jgi:hypothetical protein
VGRAIGRGHAGGDLGRESVGNFPTECRVDGSQFGVGPVHAERDDALADRKVADVRAHLDHGARALVAHDVRRRGHVAAEAIERVAPFDADGLNAHQEFLG